MASGYLQLVLHAHLPYVRHPEHESFLEERWLFEAITECYLQLLVRLERLVDEAVPYRLTLSLSPPLISMLQDPLLQQRYLAHLQALIELAEREVRRTRKDLRLAPLAHFYRDLFGTAYQLYEERYHRDLCAAFLRLERAGGLELITTAATHGYLPLLRSEPSAVRAQLRVGAALFRERFGHPTAGIWLPECGYYQGLEWDLREAGFGYFFLDSHGLLNARPSPRHGVAAPVACAGGSAAFARDPGCSEEVWSREAGYPAHPLYREYHRDIGFELDPEALGGLAHTGEGRAPTGIKYCRITDRHAEEKAIYDPQTARGQVRRDAADFLRRRLRATAAMDLHRPPPLFVAPYDAELFGHWWFEGPDWLEQVIRQAAAGGELELVTASDYLARHPDPQQAEPSPSSWGVGGYNRFWIGAPNAWLYPHLHQAARDMHALVVQHPDPQPGGPVQRALRQAGRSLLLAQASDWPFIMRSGTAAAYAETRVRDHLSRFRYLHGALRGGDLDGRRLRALEEMDNIFPNLDHRAFV